MASPALKIQRQTLSANVSTPIFAPLAHSVTVLNETAATLRVYSDDGNATAYVEIDAGWERTFDAVVFPAGQEVFWLVSVPGGVVVLIWR